MTNLIEIWRPCYNYENYFEVSNQGQIRKKSDNKILKANKCSKGYLKIRLFVSKDNFKSHKVHRLVMNTFSEIKNQPQVNHINGIKDDNRLENLEWSNNSHNIKHAWATGLFKPKQLTSLQSPHSTIFLHKEYGVFKNINEISKEFKCHRSAIRKHKLFNLKYIEV
jgi:hypothetical protein